MRLVLVIFLCRQRLVDRNENGSFVTRYSGA
jgi:hypothetical protein